MPSKGFTLVELLVVIAIISILAVVVVLTINPTELLRQGRDTSRVSDMGTLNKAVSLYYQDAMNNPSTLFMGTSSVIYVSIPDTTTATSTAGDQCQGLGLPTPPTNFIYHCAASSTYMKTDGTGWLPINFNSYVAGSVISKLPVDPTNTTSTNLYYTYETDGVGGFKVAAFFESQKEAPLMASDNGNDAALYEKGSNLALASGRGLAGYWPMDEGSGATANDLSGNNNSGAFGSPAPSWTTGKVGSGALNFNGGGYVTLPSNINFAFGTGPFTITGWFYLTNTSTYSCLISLGGSNTATGGVYAGVDSRNLGPLGPTNGVWYYNNGRNIVSAQALSVNTWYFFTFIGNGGADGSRNIRLYRNAVQEGNTYTNNYNFPQQAFVIGANQSAYSESMNGLIDDVHIYNRALSATEIQEMYNAEK